MIRMSRVKKVYEDNPKTSKVIDIVKPQRFKDSDMNKVYMKDGKLDKSAREVIGNAAVDSKDVTEVKLAKGEIPPKELVAFGLNKMNKGIRTALMRPGSITFFKNLGKGEAQSAKDDDDKYCVFAGGKLFAIKNKDRFDDIVDLVERKTAHALAVEKETGGVKSDAAQNLELEYKSQYNKFVAKK